MIEDALFFYSQLGFSYAVSAFLLWKGYKQDEKYLKALVNLENLLETHIKQKDAALALIASSKDLCRQS